jgi:hypothetical protein
VDVTAGKGGSMAVDVSLAPGMPGVTAKQVQPAAVVVRSVRKKI